MKTTTPNSIQKIILLLCLFILGLNYGQVKSTTPKTLFGKQVSSSSINPKNGFIRCATVEYEQFLQEKNPKRLKEGQFEAWLSPLVAKNKALRTSSKTAATVIIIPVVVHVIHNGEAIGTAPNITDAQVESQITVLNQDFRRKAGTPGFNANPVGADVEIEFVLAKVDPNGNPTNGIDRVSFCQPSWSLDDIDAIVKPATIWDSTQYMNMWSINFTDSTLLGYAQFPVASGLGGLDASGGSANKDGVVSSFKFFGSKDFGTNFLLASPYDKGRTMSHEVGHFLGLRHIWGDAACGNDYCADTPVHHDGNAGCPTVINCDANGNEMVENYMDYTDDACMNIFTQNQKDRILTVMTNSPRRSSLKTSIKANPIQLFANDAEVKLETSCNALVCGLAANQNTQKITILNRGTSNLTSATINYNINGGSNTAYNWTGNLAINQQASFIIIINSAANGTINASVTSANGTLDQRTSNNSDSGLFTIPPTPVNYTFTNYVFTLQQDFWGDETTWNIKDGSGVIKYFGGPYSGKHSEKLPLPAVITQNWTLADNQCYTFTIFDSQGDGLCCSGGEGFYNIKSTNGLITVASGASFTSSESKVFTTNTLATNTFEASSDIYLYPNPTKGTLTIEIPSNFGLPNSYVISNVLGQKISQKNISKVTDLTINTSALKNGVYFITIHKENQAKTLRFIKE